MDITIEYTDEEKKLFDDVHRLKERIHILEDEEFLLRREKQEHLLKNHTDGRTPLIFLILACICLVIFAADMVIGIEFKMFHFAAALTIASCAPALAIVFFILFFLSYRKYYYQVVQTEEGKKKAQELNIKNYYAEEERIDSSYKKVMVELARLKEVQRRKEQELDAIVTTRTMETNKQREEAIRKRKEAEAKKKVEEEKPEEKKPEEKPEEEKAEEKKAEEKKPEENKEEKNIKDK